MTKSLFAGSSPDAMIFGGGMVATMMGGIAAEATGGEFVGNFMYEQENFREHYVQLLEKVGREMNVWKSTIGGFIAIWLLAGCSGDGAKKQQDTDLKTYFSTVELYRVCADRDKGLYDELNMNEAGDRVTLWTVREEDDFIEANYEYDLKFGTDRVALTNDVGVENECFVVRKTDATQFQCDVSGTSTWYHSLTDAKKNPEANCSVL